MEAFDSINGDTDSANAHEWTLSSTHDKRKREESEESSCVDQQPCKRKDMTSLATITIDHGGSTSFMLFGVEILTPGNNQMKESSYSCSYSHSELSTSCLPHNENIRAEREEERPVEIKLGTFPPYGESSSSQPQKEVIHHQHVPLPGGEREVELGLGAGGHVDHYQAAANPFTIKKKLTVSDVNNLSRLLLGKQDVETHIMPLLKDEQVEDVINAKKGLRVAINDLDKHVIIPQTFKKLESSRCYQINNKWRRDFVKRRGLHEGDTIGLYWDRGNSCFCFSVLECPHN